MLKDLSGPQSELAQYMSDLSEEAFCAGWMHGLEYALWAVAIGERGEYGRLHITLECRKRLRQLAEACGGWIVFDEEKEETWIPQAAWERHYSAWKEHDH